MSDIRDLFGKKSKPAKPVASEQIKSVPECFKQTKGKGESKIKDSTIIKESTRARNGNIESLRQRNDISNKFVDEILQYVAERKSSRRPTRDQTMRRRKYVQKLHKHGYEIKEIVSILGSSPQTVKGDLMTIKHVQQGAKTETEISSSNMEEIIESYDQLISESVNSYNSEEKASNKSAYINAAIRALESKWKFMLVVGKIKKNDADMMGFARNPREMSVQELKRINERLGNEINGLQFERDRIKQEDMDEEDKQIERFTKEQDIPIEYKELGVQSIRDLSPEDLDKLMESDDPKEIDNILDEKGKK